MALIHSGLIAEKQTHQYTIAVLIKMRVAASDITINALRQELELLAPGKFNLVLFDAHNDERQLADITTTVIKQYLFPYDAIIPVGLSATQAVLRLSLYFGIKVPIFFLAPALPHAVSFLYPGRSPQNVTGITVTTGNESLKVSLLSSIKKTIRKALIPYDPRGTWTYATLFELNMNLRKNGIDSQMIPLSLDANLMQQLIPHLTGVDAICATRNNLIISNMESLSMLCAERGIVLCGTDTGSVQKGAAISVSPSDEQCGKELAQYLESVFSDQAEPSDLPIKTSFSPTIFLYNHATLLKQGISLSPHELELIKAHHQQKEKSS